MAETVSYTVGDSTEVRFEIDPVYGFAPAASGPPSPGGWPRVGGKPKAAVQVRDAIAPAVGAAKEVLDQIAAIKPDAVEVTFGIKVTGEASWVVARAAAEGSFEVKLSWTPGTTE